MDTTEGLTGQVRMLHRQLLAMKTDDIQNVPSNTQQHIPQYMQLDLYTTIIGFLYFFFYSIIELTSVFLSLKKL